MIYPHGGAQSQRLVWVWALPLTESCWEMMPLPLALLQATGGSLTTSPWGTAIQTHGELCHRHLTTSVRNSHRSSGPTTGTQVPATVQSLCSLPVCTQGPSCALNLKMQYLSPHWYGSVGWALFHKAKGRRLDSWSVHMPGLWVPSPVGLCTRGNQCKFLSYINVSLSHFLPPFPSL